MSPRSHCLQKAPSQGSERIIQKELPGLLQLWRRSWGPETQGARDHRAEYQTLESFTKKERGNLKGPPCVSVHVSELSPRRIRGHTRQRSSRARK